MVHVIVKYFRGRDRLGLGYNREATDVTNETKNVNI